MAAPVIAELPEPPVRSDAPVDFALKADAFLSAFPSLRAQINASSAWIDLQSVAIEGYATSAANDAAAAVTAKNAAVDAATTATEQAGIASSGAATVNAAKDAAIDAADRAEAAAESVEGVVGPLGTAATKDVMTSPTDTTAGRVMTVGAFGAGSTALNVGQLTNLNVVLPEGEYGYAAGATGAPNGLPGILEVRPYNAAVVRQVARPVSGSSDVTTVFERQMRNGPIFSNWDQVHTSTSQFPLGASQVTALDALGLTGLSARVAVLEAGAAVTDLGAVATAAAQTVNLDVGASRFFSASMEAANTTGILTLNFTNVPASPSAAVTWHVELLRAGRKAVAFQLGGVALTPVWTGGGAPTFNNAAGSRDLVMFYRMPGRSSVYAMLVDAGAA